MELPYQKGVLDAPCCLSPQYDRISYSLPIKAVSCRRMTFSLNGLIGCWSREQKLLRMLARPARLELTTPRLGIWCSIHLSYGRLGPSSRPRRTQRQRPGESPPRSGIIAGEHARSLGDSPGERRARGVELEHQDQVIDWRWDKPMAPIEARCLVIQGMDKDRAEPGDLTRL